VDVVQRLAGSVCRERIPIGELFRRLREELVPRLVLLFAKGYPAELRS
jgi:hypothetical protein